MLQRMFAECPSCTVVWLTSSLKGMPSEGCHNHEEEHHCCCSERAAETPAIEEK